MSLRNQQELRAAVGSFSASCLVIVLSYPWSRMLMCLAERVSLCALYLTFLVSITVCLATSSCSLSSLVLLPFRFSPRASLRFPCSPCHSLWPGFRRPAHRSDTKKGHAKRANTPAPARMHPCPCTPLPIHPWSTPGMASRQAPEKREEKNRPKGWAGKEDQQNETQHGTMGTGSALILSPKL